MQHWMTLGTTFVASAGRPQIPGNVPAVWAGVILAALLVALSVTVVVIRYYRRCPSNRILVIFGRVGGGRAAKCMHGGGTLVVPLIQDWAYLSLEPMAIDIPLSGALSLNNIRVNVPATFTVGISTDPVLMNNAAERLLTLATQQIREQAQDIILGQLRLVIATLTIEEINKDREKFMKLINENVGQEINKIGLELINVNIRDITDESGYIEAIGKRAAAEAINRAKIEVAQQVRDGATGEAMAVREREVSVAAQLAQSEQGKKEAESKRRAIIAAYEAEAVTAEAASQRDREVSIAQRGAEALSAKKLAEQEQRVRIATAEATAVTGENEARARIAETSAKLGEVEAESKRRREVAAAQASEAILIAQRQQEIARMAKETIAPAEIEAKRITVAAEAEAEKRRLEARGEADAITAKYQAESEGVRLVLEAKADGYRKLIEACGADGSIGPTLLLIEQLPKLVAEQVKAISNLKIDKITVWDTGPDASGRNATSNFLSGIVNSLPRLHELALQAGVELPAALGKLSGEHREKRADDAHHEAPSDAAKGVKSTKAS
ncbi:MAG: SPFH domain-containing protein [Phycisphaerae bacterium]|nr:SPFH domain-containing protein [Phycisphaerae bacterium]